MKLSQHLVAAGAFSIFTVVCFTGCEVDPRTPGERLDGVIDETKEAGEEFTNEAQEATGEIGDEMKARQDKTIGERIDEGLENAGEAIEDSAEKAQEAASDVLDVAGDKLEDAGKLLRDSAESASNAIEEGIERTGETLEELGGDTKLDDLK